MIVRHFAGQAKELAEWSGQPAAEGEIRGVWVSGGYKRGDWIDEAAAARLGEMPLLIVQDLFDSPLSATGHL